MALPRVPVLASEANCVSVLTGDARVSHACAQVPVLEAHDLISRFDVGLVITDEDEDKVEELAFKWTELKQLAEDANDHLQSRSPEFRAALQTGLRTLAADTAVYVRMGGG